jgi:hypothetical protein
MFVRSMSRLCILSALGTISIVLTGCALSTSATKAAANGDTSPGSPTASAIFGGKVYGAQSPIVGATVTLWAAGTTGTYGTGATSLATRTSDSNGTFNFNNPVSGVSPCTPGQHLYITSVGGNQGPGINPYAALMAALPVPCGLTTGGTFVWIDEVTTVASVTALQQFMSITPSGSPAWQIGAPATNVTGLTNAFLQVGNLANISTGVSAASTETNTINTILYTTTITPDSSKINAIADILAACINTSGSGVCGNLFTATTPGTSTPPTDTIQVAYNLATNAGGLNMPANGDGLGEPHYLVNQYVVGQAPFNPYTTTPTDWTIDVNWVGTSGTTNAASVAIDAAGNIWTSAFNTGLTTLNVTEFNPLGQVLFTPPTTANVVGGWNFASCTTCGNTVSLGGTRGDALAIDTGGNAWATSWLGSTNTIGTQIEDFVVQITSGTGTASAYLVGYSTAGIAIDGLNNIYVGDGASTTANRFYESELVAGSAPTYSTPLVPGTGRTTSGAYYTNASIDQIGYVWPATSAGETTIPRITNIGGVGTASTVGTTTALPAAVYWLTADASGNAWGSTTTTTPAGPGLEYINVGGNVAASIASPTVTQFLMGLNGNAEGGLFGPQGMAIDGEGNLWVVNANGTGSTAAGGGISEFVPSSNGTVLTPLSPSGAGVWGFFSNAGIGAPIGASIDGSGNIWFKTKNGSKLYYLVGAAAPVVTPLASQVANSKIGIRP